MFFFVPPQQTIGFMITISSYDGRVMFAASMDGRLASNAEVGMLGEIFEEELAQVCAVGSEYGDKEE